MRIFVINLDRDVDRWDHMQRELAKLGLSAERFSAYRGLDLPDWLKPYFLDETGAIASHMNAGEVGCYASHLGAVLKGLEAPDAGPVCILEDDLQLTPAFAEILSKGAQLPADWEILRLSNPAKSAFVVERHLATIGDVVRYWRVPNTTGAYVINPSGARRFLSYARRRLRPVDEDLRRPWEHRIKTYGLLPAPATPNIFQSSIEALGGTRVLPARKRFTNAPTLRLKKWRYLLAEFGLLGCVLLQIRSLRR